MYRVQSEDEAQKLDSMVSGREDGGRLVTFEGSKDDIGKFFDVKITESKSPSLYGHKEVV